MFAGCQYLHGQILPGILKDTSNAHRSYIEPGDIPVRAVEIRNKTREEIHNLVPEGTIRGLKTKTDITIASINISLLTDIDPEDVSKNIRFLENRKIELVQEQRKLNAQKAELTAVLENLDNFKNKLKSELQLWKYTRKRMEPDTISSPIPDKLTETITFLDSTLLLYSQRSNSVLNIMDKNIEASSEIDSQLERTKSLIQSRQSRALEKDHLPFFQLDFRTSYRKEIADSFRHLKEIDLVDLKEYIDKKRAAVFLTVLIFLGLLYLFINIKRKVNSHEAEHVYGHFYKEKFLKIISHPVSATVFLTLFSTLFVFTNRPAVFREISLYVIAFPLIRILSILLHKKYHFYIYAFGVLIIFYLMLIVFLNESVIYRIILLIVSAIKIGVLALFLLQFERENDFGKNQRTLIYLFVFLHLGLAAVGIIANLAGRMILTEIVLGAVFYNIFNGLSILITTLLINGLIATVIDTSIWQSLNVFRIYGEVIKRKTIYLINFLAIFTWIILGLRNFKIIDYVSKGIGSIITHKISIGSASFSLNSIFIFFLVIYIAVVLSNLLQILLEEDVLNRFSLSKGLPHTIAMMVKYSLVAGGFFLAVNAAGIPVNQLTIILGAFSVGIGFGLQNIFNNLVSGLILLFERPIQLGDTVQVGQLTGNVKSIGIRASNIRTFDGAEVIVPNGQLVSNEVINWTLSDQNRRVEITAGVSYNADPKQVHSLLMGILNNHPEVLQEPAPLVFFNGLGDSSLDFILLAWIADYNQGRRIKSEILFRIFEVLKENQIEIPFPQHDLHLRSVDKSIRFRDPSVDKSNNTEGEEG